MIPPSQLPLPLPARTALGREDYFVSEANALAVALVEGWANWPGGKFLLTGPSGSGKTHLAHVWAAISGAVVIEASELADADIPSLATQSVCVENAEAVAGQRAAEEAFFHLHNLVLASGNALLITAASLPTRWGLTLPDLQSRLEGAQSTGLGDPDDGLLSALLVKLFADRQIMPAGDVIPYLLKHMPRGYLPAVQVVSELDADALARKSGVTRPMAIAALTRLFPSGDDADTAPS